MIDVKGSDPYVRKQIAETVKQAAEGFNVRLATITCPCGLERRVINMYQCLYCRVWFCENCAEAHFGKTRDQYRHEQNALARGDEGPDYNRTLKEWWFLLAVIIAGIGFGSWYW